MAESDVGEIFLPGRSAKLESAFSELPGAVVDLRYGWDLASAGWSTGVLEDVTCRASRVGDRFASKSKVLTLDQR